MSLCTFSVYTPHSLFFIPHPYSSLLEVVGGGGGGACSRGRMADAAAVAYLQKQVTAEGSSLYGHLTRVLQQVRAAVVNAVGSRQEAACKFSKACTAGQKGGHRRRATARTRAQVLGERPNEAVDLLETSLLVKKTAFEAKESAPLVPVSVSAAAAAAASGARAAGSTHAHVELRYCARQAEGHCVDGHAHAHACVHACTHA